MPKRDIKQDDILTICCSGVVSYYLVIEPDTLLCDLIYSSGEKTGRQFNLEFDDFGFLDETKTATIHRWETMPTYQEALAACAQEWEKKHLCQNET